MKLAAPSPSAQIRATPAPQEARVPGLASTGLWVGPSQDPRSCTKRARRSIGLHCMLPGEGELALAAWGGIRGVESAVLPLAIGLSGCPCGAAHSSHAGPPGPHLSAMASTSKE